MDVVEGQEGLPLPDVHAAATATENSVNVPLNGTGSTFAAWNTPKHREEVDSYQTRLVDQGFNICKHLILLISILLSLFSYTMCLTLC